MFVEILFIVAFLSQIAYYLYYFLNFIDKKDNNLNYQPSVSIIICTKNEDKNLLKNLPIILKQAYPNFEIIIVDDNSTDDTEIVVSDLQTKFNNIQYLKIKEKKGFGKKNLIEQGVKHAKYDVLLFTDADCYPASDYWISIMASYLENKEIVLGISPYITKKKNFLFDIQNYETSQTYLQYVALANAGLPYMCVGRNVMIRKSLYEQIYWTNEDYNLASGDDDLMIQRLANSNNTATSIDSASYTYSEAKSTYKSWINQKLRHYTTGVKYKFIHQIILGLFIWTKLFLYINLFYLIYIKSVFILLIIPYFVALYFTFYKIDNYYKSIFALIKLIYVDLVTTLNIFVLSIISLFSKNKKFW